MSNWWDGDVQQEEPSAADVLSNPGASNFGDAGNEGVWQGSYDSAPQSGYQPGNGGLDTNSIYADLAMSPGPTGAYGVPGLSMYDDPDGGASAHFDNWGDWLGNMKDLGKGAMTIAGDLSTYNLGRQALSDATGGKVNIPGFFEPTDFPVDKGNPTLLAHALDAFQPDPAMQSGNHQGADDNQQDTNGGQPDTTQNPSGYPIVAGQGGFGVKKWNLPDLTGGYGV